MTMYLRNGQEVKVLKQIEDGYLVQEIHFYEDQDYSDEWVDERIIFVKTGEIYKNPPLKKFSDEIDKLQAKITELICKKNDFTAEFEKLKKEKEEKLKDFKKYEALKHIDRFLNAGITHYVILSSWRPEIIDFNDARCSYDKKNLKLLTLFGTSEGNLEWKLNSYSDGSGGYGETVVPCISYEEARDVLQKFILSEEITKERSPSREIVEIAQTHKLELPDGYFEKLEESRKSKYWKLRKEIEGKMKKLEGDFEDVAKSA